MGIISKTVILGVGVGIGMGASYLLKDKIQPVTYAVCRGVYDHNLAQMQETAKPIKGIEGVAGPSDFKLDYVVSESQHFNGLIYTDNTGKQGVITKQNIFGNQTFGFMAVDLGNELKAAVAYQIQPDLKSMFGSTPAAPSGSPSVAIAPSTAAPSYAPSPVTAQPSVSSPSTSSPLEEKIRQQMAQ